MDGYILGPLHWAMQLLCASPCILVVGGQVQRCSPTPCSLSVDECCNKRNTHLGTYVLKVKCLVRRRSAFCAFVTERVAC